MPEKHRYPHKLRSFNKVNRPTRIIFVDTETESEETEEGVYVHSLKLGYAVFTRTRRGETLKRQSDHVIHDNTEFWEWVTKCAPSKTTCYLVAHNLNFDLPILDTFIILPSMGWELTSYYTKGQTNIFRFVKDDRKLIMLDNGNFFQGKLERWGEIVGLPKLDIDFDETDDSYLLVYCQRDVEIMIRLWTLWLQFLDDNDCGSFKFTVASTALNTFRYRFMPKDIFIHNDPLALMLEREAYHGGRVECLFQGTLTGSTYYYVDVNSMYGYIMLEHEFPYGFYGSSIRADLDILERYANRYAVVASVDLDCNDNPFPVYHNHRVIYPIGTFNTTLTTPEILYALDRGWITKVWAMSWYPKTHLFRDYVQFFYGVRRQYDDVGNDGMAKICKLLVNSLYGKFGQLQYNQEIVGKCDPSVIKTMPELDVHTGRYCAYVYIGGTIFRTWREGESFDSFPAIAAHVTAYARMHLFNLYRLIPKGHCFYMDTDSLILDQVGLEAIQHLLSDTKLGALKIEVESDELTINAPKDYKMGKRVRLKGIKPNAEQISENTFRQMQWSRIPGLIRDGNLSEYTTREIEKTLHRVIQTGELTSNGWVNPFEFDHPSEPPQ